MSKPKKEPNPIRSQRLRIIMAIENIKTKDIRNILNLGEDSTLARIKGTMLLDDDDCEMIINHYPPYRIEWLKNEGELPYIMTAEDYKKHKNSEIWNTIDFNIQINDIKLKSITALLNVLGYSYCKDISEDTINAIKSNSSLKGSIQRENFTEAINEIYSENFIFKKDDKKYKMSPAAFETYIDKICDYMLFELLHSKELTELYTDQI